MILIFILLILMIIIWGFSFIIVDIAVETIPPLSIALYRFIIASISFLIIDLYLKLGKKNKQNFSRSNEEKTKLETKFTKNDWILIIVASFSGASIFFLAQYTAIKMIGPSLPALFVCLLSPVIISIFALIFFKEKLSKIKICGFIVASLGGFLLVTGGNLQTLNPESPNFFGIIFALMTPLLWAIYATVTKKISNQSKIDMLKWICYLATIELFIFVLINNELQIFLDNILNIVLLLCGIYLGLGCYVIGYFIWQNSQKKMDSSKVASFLYIEPFLTLMLSVLFQRRETIVLWNILGGLIVLVAVIIINYK